MKLFVFLPSTYWSYCGGAMGILASSFDEAKTICAKGAASSEEDLFPDESSIPEDVKQRGFNIWVLTHELEVSNQEQPTVLFNSYNWA